MDVMTKYLCYCICQYLCIWQSVMILMDRGTAPEKLMVATAFSIEFRLEADSGRNFTSPISIWRKFSVNEIDRRSLLCCYEHDEVHGNQSHRRLSREIAVDTKSASNWIGDVKYDTDCGVTCGTRPPLSRWGPWWGPATTFWPGAATWALSTWLMDYFFISTSVHPLCTKLWWIC